MLLRLDEIMDGHQNLTAQEHMRPPGLMLCMNDIVSEEQNSQIADITRKRANASLQMALTPIMTGNKPQRSTERYARVHSKNYRQR
jgi:hypothetical protein